MLPLAALAFGCTPEIGDKCRVSTDCSVRGELLCDTSQPQGYCTQLNCAKNTCREEGACVLFNGALPGCAPDDRAGPTGSRVARSFCMARCNTNADCREAEGYECADPRGAPWSAVHLEDDQSIRVCLVRSLVSGVADGGVDAGADASASFQPPAICQAPTADAGAPIDASASRVDDGGAPSLFPDSGAPGAPDGG